MTNISVCGEMKGVVTKGYLQMKANGLFGYCPCNYGIGAARGDFNGKFRLLV